MRREACREEVLALLLRPLQEHGCDEEVTREETAEWIGKMLDDVFKIASHHNFDLEQCCSKHILIVDRASDDVMYEADVRWT